jgi:two-component system cell cycle sensor histidine kinase/response regulator CckA
VGEMSARRVAEVERVEARDHENGEVSEIAAQRLAAILNEIDAIVWECDTDRARFNFVSTRAEAILGYPLSSWLRDDFWRGIVEPEDLGLAELYLKEAAREGRDHVHEYRVRSADGRLKWVRDLVRVVSDGSQSRLYGVTVDVTARRELEDRLLRAQKVAAINELAGGMANDFSGLLAEIGGYTEVLATRTADAAPAAQLRAIKQATARAIELVAQLLAFAQRDHGDGELVDLGGLIAALGSRLRRLLGAGVTLSIEPTEAIGRVRLDPRRLEQALINLAIDTHGAMPEGGALRLQLSDVEFDRAQAAELGLTEGRWLQLRIDNGQDRLTAETCMRIFDPLLDSEPAAEREGPALAKVFAIAAHAGTMPGLAPSMSSTGFSVFFRAGALSGGQHEDEEERVILLVEAEPTVLGSTRRTLEAAGYRVQQATDGHEALELLEQMSVHVDVLLSDVAMPDISGPELIARLAPLDRSTGILFMSGESDSRLLERGPDARAVGVLHKPFTAAELSAQVGKVIREETARATGG